MRALLLGLFCCAPLQCFSLRNHEDAANSAAPDPASVHPANAADARRPANGLVKPVGRHIQYYHHKDPPGVGGGLSDRMYMFSWFLNLAKFNNATLHISGGLMGAQQYLGKHSLHVWKNWFHYLGVTERCGQHPFHECEPFEGCRNITDPHTDFSKPLFHGENGCLNVQRMYNYDSKAIRSLGLAKDRRCTIGYAPQIRQRSLQVLNKYNMPPRFGAFHIRRCDRLETNGVCTSPTSVVNTIKEYKDTSHWMIFSYAEEGYIRKVKALANTSLPNTTIIFEDDVRLSPYWDGDNFYTYLIASDILNLATLRADTHICHNDQVRVERKPIPASRLPGAKLAEEPSEKQEHADSNLELFDDWSRAQMEEQGTFDSDVEVFGICRSFTDY